MADSVRYWALRNSQCGHVKHRLVTREGREQAIEGKRVVGEPWELCSWELASE